ncbi:MAG: hypothetical protein CMH53_05170 [Myxococcales bacterium]|nr:hypothetical protein [Myxococcales bacterium]
MAPPVASTNSTKSVSMVCRSARNYKSKPEQRILRRMRGDLRSLKRWSLGALIPWLVGGCGLEPIDPSSYVLLQNPVEQAPKWPAPSKPQPSECTPSLPSWALPSLSHQQQGLVLTPSADAHPIGEVETIVIEAVDDSGATDLTVQGAVSVSADSSVQILSKTDLLQGVGHVKIKLLTVGKHDLQIQGPKGRSAARQLYGYAPSLPVWHIQTEPKALEQIVSQPLERIWIEATLHIGDKSHSAKMRLHGGSSRTFAKKSFRLNLNHPAGGGLGDRIILRAEYADKTMLRNHFASRLLKAATWLPTFDTQFVNLRVNNQAYGLMLHTERVDKTFLKRHDLSSDGSLYEADPPFEKSVPGANLTPVLNRADYRLLYQHHAGSSDYEDLIKLIEIVLQLPKQTLQKDLNRVIQIDDWLVFLAIQAVIQNQDFIKKNYYLYRDPQAQDPRWTILPWDLDLSWGHLWTPQGDVLDETIFTDGSPFVGRDNGTLFYNQMVERIFEQPEFKTRYASFIEQVLNETFTAAWIDTEIKDTTCRFQLEWLSDPQKRAENQQMDQLLVELRDFVVARRAWLKTWLAEQ